MSGYRCVICRIDGEICTLLADSDLKTVELHREKEKTALAAGDIVVAGIEKIAWNLKAVFLTAGKGEHLYLAFEDMEAPLFVKKSGSREHIGRAHV